MAMQGDIGGDKPGHELVDDVLLLGRERIGVCRVDGREVGHERPRCRRRAWTVPVSWSTVEQQAVGHVELGVTLDNSPSSFKEQHVDGLRSAVMDSPA